MSSTDVAWQRIPTMSSASVFPTLPTAHHLITLLNWPLTGRSVRHSVKMVLAFASTVIPGFSLLEIHDQNFCSLLDMYVFPKPPLKPPRSRTTLCRLFMTSHYMKILSKSARAFRDQISAQISLPSTECANAIWM
jgi:hypothetical protein